MNLFKKYGIGFDISEFSIKIVQLEKSGKEPCRLISAGSYPLKKGIINNSELADTEGLIFALKTVTKDIKGKALQTKNVFVSLPEEKSFIDVLKLPVLPMEELEKAVRFEASNNLPLPIEEMSFDFQVLSQNKHIDVLVAACPENVVLPYLNSFKKAGFRPMSFEIESLSIARCLTREKVFYKPFLIVDFGENRTSFMIYSGNGLRFTSTVLTSSALFTEHLAKDLKISFEKAQDVKEKQGLGKKTAMSALKAPLNVFVDRIKQCLDYYSSHTQKKTAFKNGKFIERIILCGGGSHLKGLDDFLAEQLGVSVEIADVWLNLKKDRIAKGLIGKNNLSYTTAIGLALFDFKTYYAD